jgi:hypothetical protein
VPSRCRFFAIASALTVDVVVAIVMIKRNPTCVELGA